MPLPTGPRANRFPTIRPRAAELPTDGTLVGLGMAGLTGAGLVGLGAVSDGTIGWPCPFRALTGWDCPFCGATRMAMALAEGDVGAALGFNAPVLLVGLAVAVLWGVWMLQRFGLLGHAPGLPDAARRRQLMIALAILAIVFAVLRNLPWAPFTFLASS